MPVDHSKLARSLSALRTGLSGSMGASCPFPFEISSIYNPYIPAMALDGGFGPFPTKAPSVEPAKPSGPRYRVITDTGAEFIVEVSQFDLNFDYKSSFGSMLHLRGKLLSPTSVPAFAVPETPRHITIPDEPTTSNL